MQELSYQQGAQPQTHQQYYHEAPRHQPQPLPPIPQQQKGPAKNNQKPAKIQFQTQEHQSAPYQQQITLNPNYIQQNPQAQKHFSFPHGQNGPIQQQPEQNVQYITEEEYNKLFRPQQENEGLRQFQNQQSQKYQGPQQPKFRPQPEDIRQIQYLQQIQPQPSEDIRQIQQFRRPAPQQPHPQQLVHYGPRPGPQNSRPLADSSLEKELQRLIESNKPIPFDQRQLAQLPQSQKLTIRPHSKGHITQEQRPQSGPQQQFSFGPEQVAAYHQQIQSQASQNRYIAPAVRQQNPGKFQSPASKYQLLVRTKFSLICLNVNNSYFQ